MKRSLVIALSVCIALFVIGVGEKVITTNRLREIAKHRYFVQQEDAQRQGNDLIRQIQKALASEWKGEFSCIAGGGSGMSGEEGFYRRSFQDYVFEGSQVTTLSQLNQIADRLASLPEVAAWEEAGRALDQDRRKHLSVTQDGPGRLRLHIDFLASHGSLRGVDTGFE